MNVHGSGGPRRVVREGISRIDTTLSRWCKKVQDGFLAAARGQRVCVRAGLRPSRLRLLCVLALYFSCAPHAAFGQATQTLPKPAGPARILVLAGAPEGFQKELADRERAVEAESGVTEPRSLKALRSDASVMDSLREGGWDFVVVSGHSTFGKTLLIEGKARVGNPSEFLLHGRLLVEEVRGAGARAVLLVPPRKPGTPALDQQAIDWAYTRLGRAAGAMLAPVGDAFARVQRRRPDLALFDPHGESWSEAGAYLAASVLEATLTGKPSAAAGPVPAESGEASGLGPEVRRLLDGEAFDAVHSLGSEGGYREVPAPPFPELPTLPRGRDITLGDLQGTWRGPLRLYPWAAALQLHVSGESAPPQVTGTIEFYGERDPVSFEATDVALESRILAFRNPSDLARGRTRYRLVARGDRLEGVAELVTEDGGIYAIGSFELQRMEPGSESRTR